MWAAVFPGQGSQSIGMGKFLFDNFKVCRELFEFSSDTLKLDFKKLCFTGPEDILSLTENTQPALLLVSVCAWKAARETSGISFKFAAGHSVGEYAALVASESLSFSDALQSVRLRGQWMQSAVPEGYGGMVAALGIDELQAQEICRKAMEGSGHKPLECANFNAPRQIVLSGNLKCLEWLQGEGRKTLPKVKLIPLKVSAPFHCSMMAPAEEKMGLHLAQIPFRKPRFPVVQNVSAQSEEDPESIRKNLIRQISQPVRWVQCVEKLRDLGVHQLVEFGHGKVLSGLIKKIDSENLSTFNVNSLEELKVLETLS